MLHIYSCTERLCSTAGGTEFTSSGNEMFVRFVSGDDKRRSSGFLAQYDAAGTDNLNIGKLYITII